MAISMKKILSLIAKVLFILSTIIEIIVGLLDDDDDGAPNSPAPSIWRRLQDTIASTLGAGEFNGTPFAAG